MPAAAKATDRATTVARIIWVHDVWATKWIGPQTSDASDKKYAARSMRA